MYVHVKPPCCRLWWAELKTWTHSKPTQSFSRNTFIVLYRKLKKLSVHTCYIE